jgi:hypothetical protein
MLYSAEPSFPFLVIILKHFYNNNTVLGPTNEFQDLKYLKHFNPTFKKDLLFQFRVKKIDESSGDEAGTSLEMLNRKRKRESCYSFSEKNSFF